MAQYIINAHTPIGTDAWGGMWSSLEVSLDVVAACLPVIAPGIYRLARSGALSWSNILSSLLGTRLSKNMTSNNKKSNIDNWRQRGRDQSTERMVDPGYRGAGSGHVGTLNVKGARPAPSRREFEDLELGDMVVEGANGGL